MASSYIKVDAKAVLKEINRLTTAIPKEANKAVRNQLQKQILALKIRLRDIVANLRDPADTAPVKQSLEQSVAESTTFGNRKSYELNSYWESDARSVVQRVFPVSDKYGNINYAHKARFEITPGMTYESYLSEVKDNLSSYIFAFQQPNGDYKYVQLDDASSLFDEAVDSIKIFCSRFKDSDIRQDGDDILQIGRAEGKRKFERDEKRIDANGKAFTEFTLKSEMLKLIEQNGTDVTAVVLGSQSKEELSGPVTKSLVKQKKTQEDSEQMMNGPDQPLGPPKPEQMQKALEAVKNGIDKVEFTETKVSEDETRFRVSIDPPSTTLPASVSKEEDIAKLLQENLDLVLSMIKQEMAIFGKEVQSSVVAATEAAVRETISKVQKGAA